MPVPNSDLFRSKNHSLKGSDYPMQISLPELRRLIEEQEARGEKHTLMDNRAVIQLIERIEGSYRVTEDLAAAGRFARTLKRSQITGAKGK